MASAAASSRCLWLALLSVMTCDVGVYARAADRLGFLSRTAKVNEDEPTLRADASRCAELAAPWLPVEHERRAHEDNATLMLLRVRPFQPGGARAPPVFPGKALFGFVRRVYRCCQEGLHCRRVKGIQGRQRAGTDVEFLLTREISLSTVTRAELHLQVSNPQHLDLHPSLSSMTKRDLPTRYSLWSQGGTVELRVDLLFLVQSLQEAARGAGPPGPSVANMRRTASSSRADPLRKPSSGSLQDTDGDVWGDGALELGLVLGCSQAGSGVSCGTGIHLSHTPFMVLYYR